MSTLQMILIVLVSVKMIWYILPLITGSDLNAGNITGILLCILFAGMVRHYRTLLHMATVWKVLLVMILLDIVLDIVGCLYHMIRACRKKTGDTDTLLVLGCRVFGEEPSRVLQSRIDRAAQYLQEHPSCICVVSGGKGDDENLSEAEAMSRGLQKYGISQERIIKEDQSTTTYENFLFSKKYLTGKTSVVTSEFHMYRTLMIAEHADIHAYAVPAVTPWWLLLTYVTREMLCIPKEIITLKRK